MTIHVVYDTMISYLSMLCSLLLMRNVLSFMILLVSCENIILKLEIRSVEHGICPIAEFTGPWLNCAAILAIQP